MYRIKAPKGDTGYWVPIIANPDIVEHYSENVVDTLHKSTLPVFLPWFIDLSMSVETNFF